MADKYKVYAVKIHVSCWPAEILTAKTIAAVCVNHTGGSKVLRTGMHFFLRIKALGTGMFHENVREAGEKCMEEQMTKEYYETDFSRYAEKEDGNAIYFELWPGGPVMEKSDEAMPVTMDSVLLANFPGLGGVRRVLDLGSGSGIVSLVILSRSDKVTVDLIEIMPAAAELSRRNINANGMEKRTKVISGDLRLLRRSECGCYDMIVSNPPYYRRPDGDSPADNTRRTSRGEEMCTLEDIISTAASLLNQGGKFSMVYPVWRMTEALSLLSSFLLEPKRLRLVQADEFSPPSVFLVECVRNGKPGLRAEPVLFLRNSSGGDSEEIKKIYKLNGE